MSTNINGWTVTLENGYRTYTKAFPGRVATIREFDHLRNVGGYVRNPKGPLASGVKLWLWQSDDYADIQFPNIDAAMSCAEQRNGDPSAGDTRDPVGSLSCKSVVGGWQTQLANGDLVGPAFSKLGDLHDWQGEHADELSTRDPIGSRKLSIEITRHGDALRVQLIERVAGHSTHVCTSDAGLTPARVLELVAETLEASKDLTTF